MRPPELIQAAAVQRPVLQGRQKVAALWFPADWFDGAERARRIVGAWRPGASALRFAQGDLLRYAAPIEQHCEGLPGWPLRREGDAPGASVLCSAPLSEAERAALPLADACIVVGATLLPLRFADGEPLDPSAWLDPGPALRDTYDCSVVLPPPVMLDPEARSLRDVLGPAVPPASEQREAFLKALHERQAAAIPPGPASAPGGPAGQPPKRLNLNWRAWSLLIVLGLLLAPWALVGFGFVALLVLLVARLLGAPFSWISASMTQEPAGRPAQGGAQGQAQRPTARPPEPMLPARGLGRVVPQRWRQWLARLAVTSRLSRLLGRQQAAFLQRMLRMFDEDKLDEALRHAIPLGDGSDSLGQAFGTPQARTDLQVGQARGASTSIHLDDGFEQHLRQLYRRTFERLDREGRIDEAVFVLAELLRARQEALDYLEKHGRLAQAAELALSWDQPPAVIVRLHCLAGDWRRAVAVARRDGAFATAVLQMEKKWPDAARRLREEWGEALAQQGDWLGAVEAVWPEATLRERASAWLLTAESAGGQLAARALVQRAQLLPDTLGACAAQLQTLRDDRSLNRERAAVADALLKIGQLTPASRRIAAALCPSVLADHAKGLGHLDKSGLQRLVNLGNDPLLQADLPGANWPGAQRRPLAQRSEPLQCEPPGAGAHAILDALPLPDRRTLVALGEAGALIVDAAGRVLSRFGAPAERLVAGRSGQVALALARRDALWRVSRLDLASRSVHDLGLAAFDHFADEFDGLSWTVARGERLLVLDAARSLQDVLWQVPDLPGPVLALTAHGQTEQIVVSTGRTPELWRYQLPQRRLIARDLLPPSPADTAVWRLLHPEQGLLMLSAGVPHEQAQPLHWHSHGARRELSLPLEESQGLQAWTRGNWLLVDGGAAQRTVRLVHLHQATIAAFMRWPADGRMQARAVGAVWQLFDDRGRLLGIDTDTGETLAVTLR